MAGQSLTEVKSPSPVGEPDIAGINPDLIRSPPGGGALNTARHQPTGVRNHSCNLYPARYIPVTSGNTFHQETCTKLCYWNPPIKIYGTGKIRLNPIHGILFDDSMVVHLPIMPIHNPTNHLTFNSMSDDKRKREEEAGESGGNGGKNSYLGSSFVPESILSFNHKPLALRRFISILLQCPTLIALFFTNPFSGDGEGNERKRRDTETEGMEVDGVGEDITEEEAATLLAGKCHTYGIAITCMEGANPDELTNPVLSTRTMNFYARAPLSKFFFPIRLFDRTPLFQAFTDSTISPSGGDEVERGGGEQGEQTAEKRVEEEKKGKRTKPAKVPWDILDPEKQKRIIEFTRARRARDRERRKAKRAQSLTSTDAPGETPPPPPPARDSKKPGGGGNGGKPKNTPMGARRPKVNLGPKGEKGKTPQHPQGQNQLANGGSGGRPRKMGPTKPPRVSGLPRAATRWGEREPQNPPRSHRRTPPPRSVVVTVERRGQRTWLNSAACSSEQ